jgi:protein-S-isoprenylcysteine O-methyltransferase Ste14
MTPDDQGRTPEGAEQGRTRAVFQLAVHVVATPLVLGVLLFVTAGTFDWWQAWLLLCVSLVVSLVIVSYIWRVNPELVVARSRFRFVKRWDKILVCFVVPSVIAVFVVAALDSGRFHWLPVPWWVCAVGYFLFLLAIGLGTWGGAVNKFAEGPVRIQTERGHKVIDTGPYAVVRHPGYVSGHAAVCGHRPGPGFLVGVDPRWPFLAADYSSDKVGR